MKRVRSKPILAVVAACLLALAVVLLVASPALNAATSFTDVPADHRYREAIADLASRAIIDGYPDGTFKPNDPVLRQQFAKMIVLTGGYPVSELDICLFTDVEWSGLGGLYPDNYIAVAAQHGITLGRTLFSFAPYDNISRFQVITMVVRAADDLDSSLLGPAPADYQSTWDPALSADHGPSARRAQYNGLLAGLPLSQLDPFGAMPRGEVAHVLHNLLQLLGGGSSTTTTTEPPANLVDIADLKGLDWEDFLGQQVMVEGVFVRDPQPMLVTDLDVVRSKMPMPSKSYMPLSGTVADGLLAVTYGGKRLRVTGTVGLNTSLGGAGSGLASAAAAADGLAPFNLELNSISVQLMAGGESWAPMIVPLNITYNPSPDPHKYAIIFSGGVDLMQSHIAFWNDLVFMYRTLVGPLGFSPDHVIVLYAGGIGMDLSIPVDNSGTKDNLAAAFATLRSTTTEDDLVYAFFTNHGGGFWKEDPDGNYVYGGAVDSDNDEVGEQLSEATYHLDLNDDGDQTDVVAWDEELCAWQPLGGPAILDDDLHAMTEGINCKRMVMLFTCCFGGGQIHDLAQGGNRIVMSTTDEHSLGYSAAQEDGYYDDFGYFFISALNGADPSGDPVDADANDDGKISVVEAYNYGWAHITTPSTPQYEDSGDGIPHAGAMPAQEEGTLGSNTYLGG